MAKLKTGVWRPEPVNKRTSIGGGKVKRASMNKHKKRSFKKNRGQG